MDIGSKLKEIRTLKGLTQEELADRAELSKGFISQLERNLTSPSIATLTDILQCLGTTLGEFFNETPEEQVVFGKADYFEKYDAELKNEIRWIIPNAQKNMMEPILIWRPGALPTRTTRTRARNSAMCCREASASTSGTKPTGQRRASPSTLPRTRSIISQAVTAHR